MRHADPEVARKTVPVGQDRRPRGPWRASCCPASACSPSTSESAARHKASDTEQRSTAQAIAETLATFDIPARVVDWVAGPTVTLFEVEIAKGVRLSRVTALADDLALSLAASTVRILAPIPGKALVGIEVPNVRRSSVTLGDVLAPAGEGGPLLLAIGKDVAGAPVLADLATMPHLLIGGTTGSGKSVAINAMLMSILMRTTPAEVRHHPHRPQARRALALQQRPAPLRSGRHRAQGGGERAGVVRLGDGAPPQGPAGRRRAATSAQYNAHGPGRQRARKVPWNCRISSS